MECRLSISEVPSKCPRRKSVVILIVLAGRKATSYLDYILEFGNSGVPTIGKKA